MFIALLVFAFATLAVPLIQAASVVPTIFDNWESGGAAAECGRTGGSYAYAYKVDANAPNGSWTSDGNTITIYNSNNSIFSWSATIPIGAVIVKAGTGANVYFYNPPASGDTDLSAYEGREVSHVTFCWNEAPAYQALQVSKTANGTITRTNQWGIDKDVLPSQLDLFDGESGSVTYTVTTTVTGYTDAFSVSGAISVYNPNAIAATNVVVTDSLSGSVCTIASIAPMSSESCNYSIGPSGTQPTSNTASASADSPIPGGSVTVGVSYGAPNVLNPTVTVTDSVTGALGTFSDGTSVNYDASFSCPGGGTYHNTATIDGSTISDNASVTVNCYTPSISKDASGEASEIHSWDVDKSVDPTSQNVQDGATAIYNWTVTLTEQINSSYSTSGSIIVTNPHPTRNLAGTVSDVLSDGTIAIVSCPATFPPGDTTCTYTATPGSAAATNTATLTAYGIDYSFTANVNWTTTVTGTPAVITDNQEPDFDPNGLTVSSGGTWTQTDRYICPAANSGVYVNGYAPVFTDTNTVTVTWDGGTDSDTVQTTVRCFICTRTIGYWQTHSSYGPAPYDATWNGQENLPFFSSGKTWYQAITISPGGNAYWILARQYIGALLNQQRGANTSAITTQLARAAQLLSMYTPSNVPRSLRAEFTALATTLDNYNNGVTGPGHCG